MQTCLFDSCSVFVRHDLGVVGVFGESLQGMLGPFGELFRNNQCFNTCIECKYMNKTCFVARRIETCQEAIRNLSTSIPLNSLLESCSAPENKSPRMFWAITRQTYTVLQMSLYSQGTVVRTLPKNIRL